MQLSPFQKYGLILLACFMCIVLYTDYVAQWNLMRPSTMNLYLPYISRAAAAIIRTKSNGSLESSKMTSWSSSEQPVLIESLSLRKSFLETFRDFPWSQFEESAAKNDTEKGLGFSKLFIDELTYFLELESLVPINDSCTPPQLPSLDEIDCTKYPNAFKGSKRNESRKIGVLVQLGFDLDILEIHFNELFGVVDLFFVTESTHAHFGNVKKPLMWEHVQQQERFKKFPVVHFIIDDAEGMHASAKMWEMEYLQERRRWEKFLEWNEVAKFFNDEDVIGFGDTDEIPSRANVHMLKYCEFPGPSIDFGIWFPYGHINQAFRTDFPIKGHPLTLGDPTYFKLKDAKSFKDKFNAHPIPNRRRGGSPNYLLGGIHMSHYGYLPFQLVKYTTASEGGLRKLKDIQQISKYFVGDNLASIRDMEIAFGATPKQFKNRIKKVNLTNDEMRKICVLPWFYDCNRQRYPVWEDGHDTRLD